MSSRFTRVPDPGDVTLIGEVERIATAAGARLLDRWSATNRPTDRETTIAALDANEKASSVALRRALERARPQARWVDEEHETMPLPAGEWWVVDAVEGNVNHIHGLPEWGVSIALVRDGVPVLAVVRQPVGDRTFTGLRGGGAFVGDAPLAVSAKRSLDVAIVATGQAEAGQTDTYRRIGASITTMLNSALLVRATVPSTFPVLLLAAGHIDVFWQFAPTLPGVAAGVLLATEAGGTVSTIDDHPWAPGVATILIAAPGVHAAARHALAAAA